MRPADAVAGVQAAMGDAQMQSQVIARVSTRLISAHRLGAPYEVWIQGFHDAELSRTGLVATRFRGLNSDEVLIEMFRGSFPGANDARLQREIVTPTRRQRELSATPGADTS